MTTHLHNSRDVSQFGRVGLLYGGTSSEREISLMSGEAVYGALINMGVDTQLIDAQDDIATQLADYDLDRIFIALHGPGGEDGKLQSTLEGLKIPYTGSGVLASELAMDKKRCKELWKDIGLPTTDFFLLHKDTHWSEALSALGGKAMVKPASEGSSIGMSRVEDANELKAAWSHAANYDAVVIAEPLLEGEEYTVAILGDQILPSIRIRSNEIFYDYQAKYFSDETAYFCPSGLSPDKENELQKLSLDAFNSLGCEGWGRVDVMADSSGAFQLLEVNTVPGMTSHSLVPMAAIAAGMDFDQLVFGILEASTR